jgi:hypothetical protein
VAIDPFLCDKRSNLLDSNLNLNTGTEVTQILVGMDQLVTTNPEEDMFDDDYFSPDSAAQAKKAAVIVRR